MSNIHRITSNRDYLISIAEGEETGHTSWSKIGWNPAITTNFEDLWSYGGTYTFPALATKMQVASDSATADADIGTQLFAETCDAGGTATTMLDAGVDFSATAVAGDIVLIEKAGTTPEWGVITTAANGSITFSGGLSSGGSCATARTYQILDSSASTGAMAVIVDYLDATYASKTEIMTLNTTTQVESLGTMLRINGMRVIACGTKAATPTYVPAGNIALRATGVASPFYTYITLGFTRARNNMYTVPLGKTLYVNKWDLGAVCNNDTKVVGCRIMTMANLEPTSKFLNGNIFYPYTEMLVTNQSTVVDFKIPTKFPAKTDIKVRAMGLTGYSGPVTSVLRGWLET